MSKPPSRYLVPDEYDGDQVLATIQARRAGREEPRFESPAYRRYRSDVLAEGGLIEESEESEDVTDLESMTPDQHLQRIRRDRR